MNLPWPWQYLQLDQSAAPATVRRRYAELLKLNRPEDNPEGFQQLRRAYEICLAFAREREAQLDAAADGDIDGPPVTASAPVVVDKGEPVAAVVIEPAVNDVATEPPPHNAVEAPARPAPIAIAAPALRAPDVVVDELFAIDAATPPDSDALARWFAECPEFASFVSRPVMEHALLQRITTGARPTLRALQMLGGAFGWRQLGFERRLLQIGIPRAHIPAIDTALFHAGAEAQYAWHFATKPNLTTAGYDTLSVEQELHLLSELRDRRATPPGFRALLSGQRLGRINRLLNGWSQRYGDAATQHLFGAANVAYWRSALPGSPPNLRQSLAGAARGAKIVLLLWTTIVLIGAIASGLPPDRDSLAFVGPTLVLLAFTVPVIVVINGWRLALYGFSQLAAAAEATHERWRARAAPWFAPVRALPISLGVGLLFGVLIDRVGTNAVLTGLAVVSTVAFGWRSLAAAALIATMAWVFGAIISGDTASALPWHAAAVMPLPLLWFADWVARRRLPQERAGARWRRIFGYSFIYGVLAILATFVAKIVSSS